MDSRRLQPVFHWSSNVSHFCAATSRTIQRGSVQRYRILHNLIENTPPKKSLILQENALKSSCFGIWSRRTIFWPPTDANLEDFNISEYDPSSSLPSQRPPPFIHGGLGRCAAGDRLLICLICLCKARGEELRWGGFSTYESSLLIFLVLNIVSH